MDTFGHTLGTVRSLCAALLLATSGVAAAQLPPPLPVESIPATRALPSTLSQEWALVHDVNGHSITDGRVVFVDMGEKAEVRAQVAASYLANYQYDPARSRLYVAETFYSRVTRGTRTDVVSIYDTTTLKPVGEIALPGAKRSITVPDNGAFQLVNDGQWGLVYNFTPAASVTVVDLIGRRVLSEVEIPGCSMIYPMAGRAFATLCGDGTMLSVALDERGNLASTQSSDAFNTIDDDPMFMRNAMNGRIAWFATFRGNLRSIDLSGPTAVVGETIALPRQEGGDPEWRPSGAQIIAADANGLIYVLMTPGGREGSHKDPGTEVWVFDPKARALVRRIPLAVRALSIAVTREAQPKLATLGIDKALRIYDPASGTELRAVPAVGLAPLLLTVVP